jgi:NDP-hexose-3-ketoreductase
MSKLRIGLLGASKVALKNVIPSLIELNNQFEIVGVSGRNLYRTIEYCKKYDLKAYKSHDELLNESLDLVYISLPNAMHYEWVIKSLQLGLNVVCEKSIGCNLAEVDAMISLAKMKNRFLLEHFQFRFHNQLFLIKTLLKEIGEIKSIRTSFCIPPFEDSNNIRYSKELGGGALLDNGVYVFQLGQQLLGNKLSIKYCGLKYNNAIDISGNLVVFDEEKKVPIFGTFGFDHVYRCDLEVVGSKGRISADRIFTAPKDVRIIIKTEFQEGYNKIYKDCILEPDNQIINLWKYVYDNFEDQDVKNREYDNCHLQAILIEQAIAHAEKK